MSLEMSVERDKIEQKLVLACLHDLDFLYKACYILLPSDKHGDRIANFSLNVSIIRPCQHSLSS